MILKGSQRGDGADLAIHLLNQFDNERVEIAEVYGTIAGDPLGAFAEMEAVARGTRAREYLYSLSINPPKPLTREQYYEAIQRIEHGLGLTGQPRVVVFHVKDGREHAHVVWSRIDTDRMRAIQMDYDHSRLMDMAVELARKYGFALPSGLKAWEENRAYEKKYLDATMAERAVEKETGISLEERSAVITSLYERSDTAEAFRAALEERGYVVAQGDRRAVVVVDEFAKAHSLTRQIKGHPRKDVKAKLAALSDANLPTVDEAKDMVRQRINREVEAKRQRLREQDLIRRRELKQAALRPKQAKRRLEALQAEQEMKTRQQAEKLSLRAAQWTEARSLPYLLRRAVAELIARVPGLRSVLGPLQKLPHLDPRERHRRERDALARRHEREALDIARQKRLLRKLEARERHSLEVAIVREQRLADEARLEAERHDQALRGIDNMAMQDFHDAARDDGLWRKRRYSDGDISVAFNDAAEFEEGADRASGDDDGDGYKPDWTDRAETQHNPKPKRGKGYKPGSG